MKLMTYNILNGGQDRLPLIFEIVRKVNPDYLTINEANGFDDNDKKILLEMSKKTMFPFSMLAKSGEYNYHVVVFSKIKFKSIKIIRPLVRAGIQASIQTNIGDISIVSTHLTPYSEDFRLPEIDTISQSQQNENLRILTGDMNSLSNHDNYDQGLVRNFNEMQLKKFTTNGKLRFDAIDKIMSYGYVDTALFMKKNQDFTAPTLINENSTHTNMRLDYCFVSKPLLQHVTGYQVIKNDLTNKASDHYPVVVEMKWLYY